MIFHMFESFFWSCKIQEGCKLIFSFLTLISSMKKWDKIVLAKRFMSTAKNGASKNVAFGEIILKSANRHKNFDSIASINSLK